MKTLLGVFFITLGLSIAIPCLAAPSIAQVPNQISIITNTLRTTDLAVIQPPNNILVKRSGDHEIKIVLKPNQTMWHLFVSDVKKDLKIWDNAPGAAMLTVSANALIFLRDVVSHMLKALGGTFKWFGNAVADPKDAWKDVTDFSKETGTGLKVIWQNMLRRPGKTLQNVFGGMLWHIYNHPAEWTAETILLLVAAKYVLLGIEKTLTTMIDQKVVMGTVLFLHLLDDPIMMLPTILAGINAGKTASEINPNLKTVKSDMKASANHTSHDDNHKETMLTSLPSFNPNSTSVQTIHLSMPELKAIRDIHCKSTMNSMQTNPRLSQFKLAIENEAKRNLTGAALKRNQTIDAVVNQTCFMFFARIESQLREKSNGFKLPVEIPVLMPMASN
ncbi:hypothetical protein BKA69DRAFT_1045885 [Paraphysoderma sedebokerense]|nr:hypothetical protein BKA69DRAFT_1045885 [Paraphysoderma sedebokerense]